MRYSGHPALRTNVSSLNQAGFSLIEMLAALAVTSLVVMSISNLAGQWLGSLSRGSVELQRAEMLALAADRLVTDLNSALPGNPVGPSEPATFIGSKTTIWFLREPDHRHVVSALEVVRLSYSPPAGLERATGPFEMGRPVEEARLSGPDRLLPISLSVEFGYQDNDGRWHVDWRFAQLPAAVRVKVSNDQTVTIVPRARYPAICGRASDFATCTALMKGELVGLPELIKSDTSRNRDQSGSR